MTTRTQRRSGHTGTSTRLINLSTPGKRTTPEYREPPPLLSMTEAAARLGIGLDTLKARIADGTIYAIPVGLSGKHFRVPVAEVEKYRRGGYDQGPHTSVLD